MGNGRPNHKELEAIKGYGIGFPTTMHEPLWGGYAKSIFRCTMCNRFEAYQPFGVATEFT